MGRKQRRCVCNRFVALVALNLVMLVAIALRQSEWQTLAVEASPEAQAPVPAQLQRPAAAVEAAPTKAPEIVGAAPDKFAVATFLSNDPRPGRLAKLDGAGVLAESIRTHMGHLRLDIIAMVTPKVQTSRPILVKFGYKILEFEEPDVSKFTNDGFRADVVSSGCCGHAEMVKLRAYCLTEYTRVVVMDTDMLVHQSFEELFTRREMSLYTAPGETLSVPEYMQGAFLVVRPNVSFYNEVMDTWYAANYDGRGWNMSGIGFGYGGQTVQGILPFFFRTVYPENAALVDHCTYNHNGEKGGKYCPGFDGVKLTKVNHFTLCQKPWYCLHPLASEQSPECIWFSKAWWRTYKKLAAKFGRSDLSGRMCAKYMDGLSDAYRPLLREVEPVISGW